MILVLFVVIAMEAYTRTPDKLIIKPLELPRNTKEAVLLFHGAKDELNPEIAAIANKYTKLVYDRKTTKVLNYDWSSGANNRLRAGTNAMEFGRALGEELAKLKELQHIRIIAHSASGFIPDELCRTYKDLGGTAHIETTFLDAFGLRGLLDSSFGARNHGSCPDFSANIVNTDDPAPTTNKFFKNAWNLDVTGLKRPQEFIYRTDPRTAKEDIWLGVGEAMDDVKRKLNNPEQQHNGHYWPPYYFLTVMDEHATQPEKRDHKEFPRGTVSVAKPLLVAEQ